MFWTRRSVWQRVGLPALGCSLHLVRLASVPWLCKYTQCIRVTYWDALCYLIDPNAFGAHAQFLAFDWPRFFKSGVTFLEDRLFKTRQNPRPTANICQLALALHRSIFFSKRPGRRWEKHQCLTALICWLSSLLGSRFHICEALLRLRQTGYSIALKKSHMLGKHQTFSIAWPSARSGAFPLWGFSVCLQPGPTKITQGGDMVS